MGTILVEQCLKASEQISVFAQLLYKIYRFPIHTVPVGKQLFASSCENLSVHTISKNETIGW
jgi:hypothetical protein